MAELKTRQNDQDVAAFIGGIADETKRADCETLIKIMKKITGRQPRMWGSSIVGFGSHHYKYESGREGDWFVAGFSPRKQNLTLYIMDGFSKRQALLKKLGKHSTGRSCLYVKRLADVDLPTLKTLIEESVKHVGKSSA